MVSAPCEMPVGEVVDDDMCGRAGVGNLLVRVKDTNDAFMNQLRWAITRDIPSHAIHEVTMLQTSPFPDEYIAHRVGLMAFRLEDPNALTATAHLEVRTKGRILAGQFEGVQALFPTLIVATLPRNCSMTLTAKLNVGLGKQHQRYNHVAAARVTRRSRGFDTELDECWCVDTPPGNKCKDCAGTRCPDTDAPIEHMMTFESFGVHSPREVLRQAILTTREKLHRIVMQLKEDPGLCGACDATPGFL